MVECHSDEFNNYRRDRNKWNDENSVPVDNADAIADGWKARMVELTTEASRLQSEYYDAKSEEWQTLRGDESS